MLRICSKDFEKLVFRAIFRFVIENSLLSSSQSSFKSKEFCVNQLISITHRVFRAFDENLSLEDHGVVLYLSKTFDRVWYKGLLNKLKSSGINGNLLDLIELCFHNRRQRPILNGQLIRNSLNTGVSQGSVLGSVIFPIYINDLPQGLICDVKLSVAYTSWLSIVNYARLSVSALKKHLLKMRNWGYQWKMKIYSDWYSRHRFMFRFIFAISSFCP